jgi:hypothetical protein
MFMNTERAINTGQSRETGNMKYTRHKTKRIPKGQSKMDTSLNKLSRKSAYKGQSNKTCFSSSIWSWHKAYSFIYILVFIKAPNGVLYILLFYLMMITLSSKSSDRKCLVNIRDILKRRIPYSL